MPTPDGGNGVRLLITGANGFVGRHLIARLLSGEEADPAFQGVMITAGVKPTEIPGLAEGEYVCGNSGWLKGTLPGRLAVAPLEITDAASIQCCMEAVQPDWICHLAGRASGADRDRDGVFAVNVQGTRDLLESASKLKPFPRTLVISTGYVYGDTDPERPAREEDPVGPLWRYGPYTDSKIEMESVVRSYRGLVIVARAFSHSGPGQAPQFALPAFARQLARIEAGEDKPILRVGNLDALRDMLDVRDVVRAYLLLLQKGVIGETYNVSNANPVSIRYLLDGLRAQCSIETSVELDPSRMRPADISCSTGDTLKLWAQAGWQPRIPLEKTLSDTLQYWRDHIAISGC